MLLGVVSVLRSRPLETASRRGRLVHDRYTAIRSAGGELAVPPAVARSLPGLLIPALSLIRQCGQAPCVRDRTHVPDRPARRVREAIGPATAARPQLKAVKVPEGVVGDFGPVLFARTAIPSVSDQIHPYLTLDEVVKYIEQPAPLVLPETEQVVEIVKRLPFEGAMRWTALIQRLLAKGHVDAEFQEALAREVYPGQFGDCFVRALREFDGHAVAISEPQLFALQRLLVLHARDDVAELTPLEHARMRTALAAIPCIRVSSAACSPSCGEQAAAR